MSRRQVRISLLLVPTILALLASALRAADTLPSELSAEEFWTLVETLSEPGGRFPSENFLSNETEFQAVIPTLRQAVAPGAVYLGVGPEQNFTYIAAIRPKMAFIIDIRRQNMVEHLLYQAVFELSDDRADFLSRLFSRSRPAGLTDQSSVDDLFLAYASAPADDAVFQKNLQDVTGFLTSRFPLADEDLAALERIYSAFRGFGPDLSYSFGSRPGRRGRGMPSYADLMTTTAPDGRQRSYLASEESFRFVRDLEVRHLIVPVTGDFAGSTSIRAIARYLKDRQATVGAFYTSNVEQYLFQGADSRGNVNGGRARFYDNVETLPLDATSLFIRSSNAGGRGTNAGRGFVGAAGRANTVASIQETLAAVVDGRIGTYNDLFGLSR